MNQENAEGGKVLSPPSTILCPNQTQTQTMFIFNKKKEGSQHRSPNVIPGLVLFISLSVNVRVQPDNHSIISKAESALGLCL